MRVYSGLSTLKYLYFVGGFCLDKQNRGTFAGNNFVARLNQGPFLEQLVIMCIETIEAICTRY